MTENKDKANKDKAKGISITVISSILLICGAYLIITGLKDKKDFKTDKENALQKFLWNKNIDTEVGTVTVY